MTREEADKLDAIAHALSELSVSFQRHDAKEEACRQKVHDLSAELWGNGKDGIKTRVDRIEQRAQMAKDVARFAWGGITAVAVVVGFVVDRLFVRWMG